MLRFCFLIDVYILLFFLFRLAFEMGVIQFPSVTDVNTRVRRLVTAFQRNNKKLEIRNAQKAKVYTHLCILSFIKFQILFNDLYYKF